MLYIIIFTFFVGYNSKVLLYETFDDDRYNLRWYKSIDNLDKQGTFRLSSGSSNSRSQGLRTEDEYRYYLLSRKMKRRYSNKNKTLIIQLQVMFPALMECGGAYIKILGFDFEPTTFTSKTQYKIMFGPDVCGYAFEDRDVKVILNYQGKYYMINQIIRYHITHIPQLFTLIIRPDNTYEVHVNASVVAKGHIGRDFRMIRPKKIRDKSVKPPKDWAMSEMMFDDSVKPPPHIRVASSIVNPMYFKNASLFDPARGIPYIPNPSYMKPWHPPIIRNHNYKGKWQYPLIPNPKYNPRDNFYLQTDIGGVGIDIWQMSSGVIYDSILVTDNEQFAKKLAKENWKDVLDAIAREEANQKPSNNTQDYDLDDNDPNDRLQEALDDTGQKACINSWESTKNTIFGPSKESMKNIKEIRKLRMERMKEDMMYQIATLPEVSFYNKKFFSILNIEPTPLDDTDLDKRIKSLEDWKLTDTAKFMTQYNLLSID